MMDNYHKEVEASMIQKFLDELSSMCGDSVVLRGLKLYLLSRDKTITNLSSFVSD